MSSSRREYFRRTRKVRMRELNYSVTGWIGLIFDVASAVMFLVTVILSYRNEGEALFYVGSIGLFALVFSVGGLVLGIMGIMEENIRPIPPRIAIVVGAVMSALLAGLYIYGF